MQMRLEKIKRDEYYDPIEANLEKIFDQKEVSWKQCSRMEWLAHGDQNSKYFHNNSVSRRLRKTL